MTDEEALQFHQRGKPGKLEITPTKPMATQRDLSLAYSPGVAAPSSASPKIPILPMTTPPRAISSPSSPMARPFWVWAIWVRLASKPVMEGKAVLFKRFADVDSIDLEVDTKDVEEFIGAVRYLGPTFGGINLEDIKAPDCFIIEQRLRELMDIPVFHDDQHGTAIISTAALINALQITGRDLKDFKLVCNGAGAAAIACVELVKSLGVPNQNVILCDSKGVVYKGRTEGMNQWKSAHAVDTDKRTLADAMAGADVFFGLSVAGALSADMVQQHGTRTRSFLPWPILIRKSLPEDAHAVRGDVIMATGRSDYPNQVNNVLGFPYIFRGALDVRARTINDEMKIAAANALAELAREDVPDEVAAAYHGSRLTFGRDYLIPVPFDPRLISRIPVAVAKAAMESGVARHHIADLEAYAAQLSARLDPIAGTLQTVYAHVRANPKRVVFAEGEEDRMIRAANSFAASGLGTAILIGRESVIEDTLQGFGHRTQRECGNHQRPHFRAQHGLCQPSLCQAATRRLPAA